MFLRCEDFLWSVRCHMHFVTDRPEERLSFDIQREIAVRLGYTEHPGMRDVERFMKHYFLTAKNVGRSHRHPLRGAGSQSHQERTRSRSHDRAVSAEGGPPRPRANPTISSSTTIASISPNRMCSSAIRST